MLLQQDERQPFLAEVDCSFGETFKGLGTRPREISARWLYDPRGSELFEAITATA